METAPDVGAKVRELRQNSSLSLRALAEICDVSPNTVSLIERGLSSPCVDTLQRLAAGLGVPITAFFEAGDPPARLIITRASSRTQSRCPGMTIDYLSSGLPNHALASFLITMDPGASTDVTPIVHAGAEWAYCLEGTVHYEVEGHEYQLGPGDTLLFESSLPHRWHNPGEQQTRMLLIMDAETSHVPGVEQHLLS